MHGELTDEAAERRLDECRDRYAVALIGKSVMLGEGMNQQKSCKAVFAGVTSKFRHTNQTMHRQHASARPGPSRCTSSSPRPRQRFANACRRSG